MTLPRTRLVALQLLAIVAFGLVFARLFYWQVWARSRLQALAQDQYRSVVTSVGNRGEIRTSDGFPLVTNQPVYTLFVTPQNLTPPPAQAADLLAPLVYDTYQQATSSPIVLTDVTADLTRSLSRSDKAWVPLVEKVDAQTKTAISALPITGLGFDEHSVRTYPEASLAAQLLGFVGANNAGQPLGYFGLEGFYDLELTGRPGLVSQEADVLGRPIATAAITTIEPRAGRTLITNLDRGVQLLVEKSLRQGITAYGAQGGDITVMDPHTGRVLAMAALPSFDPAAFWRYPAQTYSHPAVASAYEPGSVFKTLVMAAALDSGQFQPDDTCDTACAGPVTIGQYAIRTWDNTYHPGQTLTQILERSDNVGMVHIAQKLGQSTFVNYLERLGIGQPTYIDLEGETTPALRATWGDIDIATGAFGQGLAVTSIRLLTSVAVIANGGHLIEPRVVSGVVSADTTVPVTTRRQNAVIKPETARSVTAMMVQSAAHGEAHWRLPQGYQIAGKTGTAQVPIAGHYDPTQTIASFIGFAPAQAPRFIMLVKLNAPTSSPWASETAAPLWFDLTTQLLRYFNIPPDDIP